MRVLPAAYNDPHPRPTVPRGKFTRGTKDKKNGGGGKTQNTGKRHHVHETAKKIKTTTSTKPPKKTTTTAWATLHTPITRPYVFMLNEPCIYAIPSRTCCGSVAARGKAQKKKRLQPSSRGAIGARITTLTVRLNSSRLHAAHGRTPGGNGRTVGSHATMFEFILGESRSAYYLCPAAVKTTRDLLYEYLFLPFLSV